MSNQESTADVIVVGAGSAGCTLTNRLTENKDRRVLLIEAGPIYTRLDQYPAMMTCPGVFQSTETKQIPTWEFPAELSSRSEYKLPRGKISGGSSAINGALWNWGLREDFEAWALAVDDERWGPKHIYKRYREIENDLDFSPPEHGDRGLMRIGRQPSELWTNFSRGFVDACVAAGHSYAADTNRPENIGAGPIPTNAPHGVRQNSATTFLADAIDRPNLSTLENTTVNRIIIENSSVIGVEISNRHGICTQAADEVILCAGAIKSAHLLMLSGIGPSEELRRHNISIVQESPGVGTKTTDHSLVQLWVQTRGVTKPDPWSRPLFEVALNYSSGNGYENDMMLLPSTLPLSRQLPQRMPLMKNTRLFKSRRSGELSPETLKQIGPHGMYDVSVLIMDGENRGSIRLKSTDPKEPPVIKQHYLEDPADQRRMREGIRLTSSLFAMPEFADIGIQKADPLVSAEATDTEVNKYAKTFLGTAQHLSSSCRMGATHDECSVVDSECRVFGVQGLRVADTSIMPKVGRRGPASTAIMIGAHLGAMM